MATENMTTNKRLTVDDLIHKLTEYKEKYSGDDELEVHVYLKDCSYSGLSVYDVDREDKRYCEIYVEDSYGVYNN